MADSDINFFKEFNEAKKTIIYECCKYFSHKYELEEHYKEYSLNEDCNNLIELLIDSNLSKSSKKKKIVTKDPNKPKKPASAYIHFTNSYRDMIKEQNPNASLGEISKMLGGIWQELESNDKLPFEKKFEEDKNRYKKEIEIYNSQNLNI